MYGSVSCDLCVVLKWFEQFDSKKNQLFTQLIVLIQQWKNMRSSCKEGSGTPNCRYMIFQ